jgi:hypothetical protein
MDIPKRQRIQCLEKLRKKTGTHPFEVDSRYSQDWILKSNLAFSAQTIDFVVFHFTLVHFLHIDTKACPRHDG